MTQRKPLTAGQLRAREDLELMVRIAERGGEFALQLNRLDVAFDRISALMDLECVHEKMPLDLQGLLEASDSNFAHDFFGIRRHLNRETRELENCFVPRYARREQL